MILSPSCLEKRFTVFSLLFLTNIFGFQSLYSSPDPKIASSDTYYPLDPLLSLLQYGIYAITLFLVLARWKNSLHAALRDKCVWLLAGIALISYLWSDFPAWSLQKGITTLQTAFFGLYMASRFSLKQQLQMLAWTLAIVSISSLLFTLAFPGAAIESGANAGAWRGPFVQKNILARLVVLGAIVFLLLALNSSRHRYWLWGGFSLSVLLILLTGSKTALLLLLILLLLLPLYRALRWKGTIAIPLVITTLLVAGSIALLITNNWEGLLLTLGRDSSLSGRTDLWELAIEKIRERLWLGYGYQGFWKEGGGAVDIWQAERYRPPHAHNGFINITLDLGLTGLFIFLSTIAVNFRRSIAWLRSGKTTIELWPVFYITFFFMYNHTENTIIEHNSIFWVLLVAVSLSIRRNMIIQLEGDQKPVTLSAIDYT